jgi:hypothetical protein
MRQPQRAAGTRVSGNGARGAQGIRRGSGEGTAWVGRQVDSWAIPARTRWNGYPRLS